MARIPYVEPEQMPAPYAELLKSRNPLNLYRMLPHAVDAASPFLALGGSLLRKSELDPVLREIAILRVGLLSNASYEVHQHRRVARAAGMPEDVLAAIADGPEAPAFDDLQRLVMRFTDEVVHRVKASDVLFDAARARLGDRQVAELVLTIGFYMMVSRFLENFEVDIEADTEAREAVQ